MSLVPEDSEELVETLESTRRNVRQLEMDAYRIRTDLTRLEVALETRIANGDHLARHPHDEPGAPNESQSPVDAAADPPPILEPIVLPSRDVTIVAPELQPGATLLTDNFDRVFDAGQTAHLPLQLPPEIPQQDVVDSTDDEAVNDVADAARLEEVSVVRNAAPKPYRFAARPVLASIVLHGAAVLMIASITVATIVHYEKPFAATFVDLSKKTPERADKTENLDLGQLGKLDDTLSRDVTSDSPKLELAGPLVNEVMPVDFESVAGPPNLGEAGSVRSLTADLGTVLPGNGGFAADGTGAPSGLGNGNQRRGGGAARNGGAAGSALFFGTETKGDRFVFVVDNSSSMKGGRLEMAVAELVKTVNTLSPRQMFYVIFVSDKPYPMFYPQQEPALLAATPENKKHLAEWLPKAILASGKNRELIKAMDLAASLKPQAVYLLWDGDLHYSSEVRTDVMNHLTVPNQWNFTVHTLGMGVTLLANEENLSAIAQAHHGVYRRIDVPAISRKK